MPSDLWFTLLIGAVGVERVVVVLISKRHIAYSLSRGGKEFGFSHYPRMGLLLGCLVVGAVAEGWTAFLRKLMVLAHDRKRISDEELEEGLQEVVVRGSPAPRRSPPADRGPAIDEPGVDDVERPAESAEP